MKGSEGERERWREKRRKLYIYFFLLVSPRRHTELLPLDFLFYVSKSLAQVKERRIKLQNPITGS